MTGIMEEEILRQWKSAGGIYKQVAEEVEKELEQEQGAEQ